MASVIQLECQCNNYPWGKTGEDSLAARYAASTPGTHFKLDKTEQYAEMWMGTYPTTPSLILATGEDLQKYLDMHKERLIGTSILNKFGSELPYLPKILSIAKALPLQIHPDKELASRLHEKDPSKFGDSNHKPEIAVALGKFEVFVGWKPLNEIQGLFETIPALKSRFLEETHVHFNSETLKRVVRDILTASDEDITEIYTALRDTPKAKFGNHSYIPELLPRLAKQYSKSDPGNLVALLTMNFLVLEKGEAIYVPADGIHAYLSGDIVECMARSDNVLNTGFCPRADRDSVDLFTNALTFSPKSGEDAILKPKRSEKGLNGHTKVLAPPMSEFDMLVTKLKAGESESIETINGPSIMIVTSGSGTLQSGSEEYKLVEGYVFFIGCGTKIKLKSSKDLETHIAYCEA